MMEKDREHTRAKALPEDSHTALAAFRKLASELGVWLHAGSLAIARRVGAVPAATRFECIGKQGQGCYRARRDAPGLEHLQVCSSICVPRHNACTDVLYDVLTREADSRGHSLWVMREAHFQKDRPPVTGAHTGRRQGDLALLVRNTWLALDLAAAAHRGQGSLAVGRTRDSADAQREENNKDRKAMEDQALTVDRGFHNTEPTAAGKHPFHPIVFDGTISTTARSEAALRTVASAAAQHSLYDQPPGGLSLLGIILARISLQIATAPFRTRTATIRLTHPSRHTDAENAPLLAEATRELADRWADGHCHGLCGAYLDGAILPHIRPGPSGAQPEGAAVSLPGTRSPSPGRSPPMTARPSPPPRAAPGPATSRPGRPGPSGPPPRPPTATVSHPRANSAPAYSGPRSASEAPVRPRPDRARAHWQARPRPGPAGPSGPALAVASLIRWAIHSRWRGGVLPAYSTARNMAGNILPHWLARPEARGPRLGPTEVRDTIIGWLCGMRYLDGTDLTEGESNRSQGAGVNRLAEQTRDRPSIIKDWADDTHIADYFRAMHTSNAGGGTPSCSPARGSKAKAVAAGRPDPPYLRASYQDLLCAAR